MYPRVHLPVFGELLLDFLKFLPPFAGQRWWWRISLVDGFFSRLHVGDVLDNDIEFWGLERSSAGTGDFEQLTFGRPVFGEPAREDEVGGHFAHFLDEADFAVGLGGFNFTIEASAERRLVGIILAGMHPVVEGDSGDAQRIADGRDGDTGDIAEELGDFLDQGLIELIRALDCKLCQFPGR
jgi:hypothetical protein